MYLLHPQSSAAHILLNLNAFVLLVCDIHNNLHYIIIIVVVIAILGHVQGFNQQNKNHYDSRILYGSLLNIASVGLYLPLLQAYVRVIKNKYYRKERKGNTNDGKALYKVLEK